MTAHATVIANLAMLTNAELRDVQQRCAALLQFGDTAPRHIVVKPTDNDVDLLLVAVVDVLSNKGVEYAAVAMLRKQRGFSAFQEKSPAVVRFLRHALRKDAKQVQLRALARLGVALLYANLEKMGIAVSAVTIMAHIHRLPAVLNLNFPGYAQAQLMGLVVSGDRPYVIKDPSDRTEDVRKE